VYQNHFYRGGFLFRDVNTRTMLRREARPTLDELERFLVDDAVEDAALAEGSTDELEVAAYQRKARESLRADIEALARGAPSLVGARPRNATRDDDDASTTTEGGGARKGAESSSSALVNAGVPAEDAREAARRAASSFARGDKVEVLVGDEQGIVFEVDAVDERTGVCTCRPLEASDAKGIARIPIEAKRLIKYVAIGAHVKIAEGRHAGQTGTVLERGELNGDHVAVVRAESGGELTVRLAHVHESSEVAAPIDTVFGFKIHDLVQLPLGGVGVVARFDDTDHLVVHTSRGDLQRVRPADVAKTLNAESSRNVSLDARDEQVREKDVVTVETAAAGGRASGAGSTSAVAPLQKGTEATVVRAYRSFVWLQPVNSPADRLYLARARHVRVAGARAATQNLAMSYMGLGARTAVRNVTEDQFSKTDDAAAPRSRGARPLQRDRDALVGKPVRVAKGSYKGLRGLVRNASATHATVELETRSRTVNIARDNIVQLTPGEVEGGRAAAMGAGGDTTGDREADQRAATSRRVEAAHGFGSFGANFATTPMLTSQTPVVAAQTPMATHGGSMTPLYPGGGAMTPSHGYYSTPAHMTPSRATPSWGDGGQRVAPINDVWNLHYNLGGGAQTAEDDDDDDKGASDARATTTTTTTNGGGGDDDDDADDDHLLSGRRPGGDQDDDHNPLAQTTSAETAPSDAHAPPEGLPWCTPGVEALTRDGRPCRVDKVADGRVTVTVRDTRERLEMPVADLGRLAPTEGDAVKITDDGAVFDAKLLSIEDEDGIIKLESGDYKIINFAAIGKRATAGY